jgi:surface protein
MSQAKAIFSFEGIDVTIQCSTEESMKDICQRYSNKIDKNINSLIFLYGGNQLNFQLKFKEQASIIDKERNEMKVLVYKNEDYQLICPKCGEKIKFDTDKIDDIILSINNIKETINGSKLLIENIIKTSSMNSMNIQLKSVNLILNTLNEDINKINEKLKNLLNENTIKENKFNKELNVDNINNYIIAEIIIKEEDVNKNIRIINSYEERCRTINYKIKNEFKNEEEIKKCEISVNDELIPFNYFHKFITKGKYNIKYSFKNNINNTNSIFNECSAITKIDLSNFNTNNIAYMRCMFGYCSSLTNIDLSNFNTNNVTNMVSMFAYCSSLTKIDLSNFNTNNVTDMASMFAYCSSLKNVLLSNFNTNNVTDMKMMFLGCSSLNHIDLSNFNTDNVTNLSGMFYGCSSLNDIDLSNFNTNKVTNIAYMFLGCSSLTKINFYNFNTNNKTEIIGMFGGCKSLQKENIIIKDRTILDDKRLFEEVKVIIKN